MTLVAFFRRSLLFSAVGFILANPCAHAGQYFQNFSAFNVGATNFGDGSKLFSDALGTVAQVQDGTFKELALTESSHSGTRSAFELPDLDPGQPILAFSAKWNSQVYGNFPDAADGFSFNFGQLDSLDLKSGLIESGYSTGLCFSVQTYAGNNPGFYLRVNGGVLAKVAFDPANQWGVNNTTRHFWEVDWNYTNGLTARLDGQIIFTNAPTHGFIPQAGNRFVWAARSGSMSEEVRLDNILVMTGGNLRQVSTTNPFYADASSIASPSLAFDGHDTGNWWATASTNNGFIGATLLKTNGVAAYALTSGSPNRGQDPANWILEGSSNGGTNWNPVASDGGKFINQGETRAWLATNSSGYTAFRLNILQNNGNSAATTLGQLRFYEFIPITATPGWSRSLSSAKNWKAIAMSADGTRLIACGNYGPVILSTNSGGSWNQTDLDSEANWTSVASSSDGGTLYAADFRNGIFISTNSGVKWMQADLPYGQWVGVTCSADGTLGKAIATFYQGGIYHKYGYNSTWFQSSTQQIGWNCIASSAGGLRVVAAAEDNGIYTNYATLVTSPWVRTTAPTAKWSSIASSSDGTQLAAATKDGNGIWLSKDIGNSWTKSSAPAYTWWGIACSSNGNRLFASCARGIYQSIDSGVTWTDITPASASSGSWDGIACSSDGTKIAALHGNEIWFYGPITPGLPKVQTLAPRPMGILRAELRAQINPNNMPTKAWFEWGLSTNYGNATEIKDLGNFSGDLSFAANIAGVTADTTHHCRVVGVNNFGTNFGADMVFMTTTPSNYFGVTLPGDGTIPTSFNSPGGQDANQAIDRSANSKYLNFDKTNTGFVVFPSFTNAPVRALGLISAGDAPEREPASFALYGSRDGTNFTFIVSNAVPPFVSTNSIQSFTFANTNAYAAYKIIFPTVQNPSKADSMQIAEVEFLPYGEITAANDALVLELPEGASLNGVGPAKALLDRMVGGVSNKIVALNVTTNVVALITPAAGASILKGMEIISGNDDLNFPGRAPSSVTIEGSMDGVNFTNLLSATPATPAANMQIQEFSVFENTNAFTKYRVTFGPPQSGTILQVGELRLFGITPPQLNVLPSVGNLLLSWPSSEFVLQQSTNLTNWTTLANPAIVTNGESRVIVGPSADAQFFRLRTK